jgi:hypothetical protein
LLALGRLDSKACSWVQGATASMHASRTHSCMESKRNKLLGVAHRVSTSMHLRQSAVLRRILRNQTNQTSLLQSNSKAGLVMEVPQRCLQQRASCVKSQSKCHKTASARA